jgi:hypothetical protein
LKKVSACFAKGKTERVRGLRIVGAKNYVKQLSCRRRRKEQKREAEANGTPHQEVENNLSRKIQ